LGTRISVPPRSHIIANSTVFSSSPAAIDPIDLSELLDPIGTFVSRAAIGSDGMTSRADRELQQSIDQANLQTEAKNRSKAEPNNPDAGETRNQANARNVARHKDERNDPDAAGSFLAALRPRILYNTPLSSKLRRDRGEPSPWIPFL